jgi:tyrosine-protein phosphatase YwqE
MPAQVFLMAVVLCATVMLEVPEYFIPEAMLRFLESLIKDGIVPVISHPERCSQLRSNGLRKEMIRLGAATQITAMSLTEFFGQQLQTVARSGQRVRPHDA